MSDHFTPLTAVAPGTGLKPLPMRADCGDVVKSRALLSEQRAGFLSTWGGQLDSSEYRRRSSLSAAIAARPAKATCPAGFQPIANAIAPRIDMPPDQIAPVAPQIVAAADPLWLPSVEMARMVGCHPRTLRRWAAKGLIPTPALTAARSRRWPVHEVLAAMEAARETPKP
jgi:MerR family regulatory protein